MSGRLFLDIGSYLKKLSVLLNGANTRKDLYDLIVNSPFSDKRVSTLLGLGFLSLVLVNKNKKTVDRIAISDTDTAHGAMEITVKPFEELKVPLDQKGNAVVEAIKSRRYQQTNDWYYLLNPALTADEARLNQAGAGIASSFVYPLTAKGMKGAIIFQFYITTDKIAREHHDFMYRYTKLASGLLEAHST